MSTATAPEEAEVALAKALARFAAPVPQRYVKVKPDKSRAEYVPHPIIRQYLLALCDEPPTQTIVREVQLTERKWAVLLRMTLKVNGAVLGPFEEWGESENPKNPLKSAVSDALKRIAGMHLGLGLHLWAREHYFLPKALDNKAAALEAAATVAEEAGDAAGAVDEDVAELEPEPEQPKPEPTPEPEQPKAERRRTIPVGERELKDCSIGDLKRLLDRLAPGYQYPDNADAAGLAFVLDLLGGRVAAGELGEQRDEDGNVTAVALELPDEDARIVLASELDTVANLLGLSVSELRGLAEDVCSSVNGTKVEVAVGIAAAAAQDAEEEAAEEKRTPEQNRKLQALRGELGIPDDKWRERLRDLYGKDSSAKLSKAEAIDLIDRLEARAQQKATA